MRRSENMILSGAIEHAGKTITEIEIKEPMAQDLMHVSISKVEDWTGADFLPIISSCANIEPPVIKLMNGSDYLRAQQIIINFIETGLMAGPISLPDSGDSSGGAE